MFEWSKSKGNDFWFEESGVSNNRVFEKSGFHCTVESRFFESPRETEIGSKNREFEKSKVARNHAGFNEILFYNNQESKQKYHGTPAQFFSFHLNGYT